MGEMENSFGYNVMYVLDALSCKLIADNLIDCGISEQQKRLYNALKKHLVIYLNCRNSLSGQFLMAVAENYQAISLDNHDTIEKVLSLAK